MVLILVLVFDLADFLDDLWDIGWTDALVDFVKSYRGKNGREEMVHLQSF